MRDRLNLSRGWLEEKLSHPEGWSVRDRDDLVLFIEKKRRELEKTPENHQPVRRGREEFLEKLEEAMGRYLELRYPDPTRAYDP